MTVRGERTEYQPAYEYTTELLDRGTKFPLPPCPGVLSRRSPAKRGTKAEVFNETGWVRERVRARPSNNGRAKNADVENKGSTEISPGQMVESKSVVPKCFTFTALPAILLKR